MNTIAIIAFWVFGALLCLQCIQFIIPILHINRGRLQQRVLAHVRLQIKSCRVWPAICTFLAGVLTPFTELGHTPAILFLVYSLGLRVMLDWLKPPSVLFLGVSGSSANSLLSTLNTAMFPAKVIHLLEMGRAAYDRNVDVGVKLETEHTTSRAAFGVHWQDIVWGYLQLCDSVLVDMRHSSGNLHTELNMIEMLNSNSRDKVAILVRDDPFMMAGSVDVPIGTHVCTSVNEVVQFLRGKIILAQQP